MPMSEPHPIKGKYAVPVIALALLAGFMWLITRTPEDSLNSNQRAIADIYASRAAGSCQTYQHSNSIGASDSALKRNQLTLAILNSKEDIRAKLGSKADVGEKIMYDRLNQLGCPTS